MDRPAKCYCSDATEHHARGCRPGRPLCRWMRRKNPKRERCCCAAYHYPHRSGSGACRVGVPAAILNSPSYQREAA